MRQLVGQRAALQVTADVTPLTPDEQARAREPDRLIWCLHGNSLGDRELRWLTPWHPKNCPHPHVTEHRCTAPPVRPARAPEPDTLF
ncbi:hypothetical protein ACIRJS_32810 [Streptomyces sp. NPDC102340]|uniref:hypothetical protein n=1 Tax=unclassified Streptomyces TaxID=2593676 RepID=UPI0037F44ED2